MTIRMCYTKKEIAEGGAIMKKLKTWIIVIAAVYVAMCTAWVFIHRRLIRAAIRKDPLPGCPHWLPGCIRETLVTTEPAPEPEE